MVSREHSVERVVKTQKLELGKNMNEKKKLMLLLQYINAAAVVSSLVKPLQTAAKLKV